MEEKFKIRNIYIIIMIIIVFSISACNKSGNNNNIDDEQHLSEGEEDLVNNDDNESSESSQVAEIPTSTTKPKEEPLDRRKFSELDKVQEKVDFPFYRIEKFSSGYEFTEFSYIEKEVNGKIYSKINLIYEREKTPFNEKFVITITPKEIAEIYEPIIIDEEIDIEGRSAFMTEYIVKIIGPNDEYTEEDQKRAEKGNFSVSQDNMGKGEEYYYRGMQWEEDGIYYISREETANGLLPEDLKDMIGELIQSSY